MSAAGRPLASYGELSYVPLASVSSAITFQYARQSCSNVAVLTEALASKTVVTGGGGMFGGTGSAALYCLGGTRFDCALVVTVTARLGIHMFGCVARGATVSP